MEFGLVHHVSPRKMSRTSVHTTQAQLLVSMIEIVLVHFAGLYLLITLLSYYLCYFVVSATHNLRNFVTSVTPLLCYPLILCLFCSFVTPVTELPVTGLISLIWKKYYKLMEVLYTFPMIFKVKPIFNPI